MTETTSSPSGNVITIEMNGLGATSPVSFGVVWRRH